MHHCAVRMCMGQLSWDRLRSVLCNLECFGPTTLVVASEQQSRYKFERVCVRISIRVNPEQCRGRETVMIERSDSQQIEVHQGSLDLQQCRQGVCVCVNA